MFMPHLSILPPSQRRLWAELAPATAAGFILYGGTALALQLAHRESVDFDFFGTAPLDPGALYGHLPFLQDARILQQAPNTLTCRVERGEPVKVSFFGLPTVPARHPPPCCGGYGPAPRPCQRYWCHNNADRTAAR